MRLVDDDRERMAAMLAADLFENVRKLLDSRYDNLLAAFDEVAQVAGMVGVPDGRTDFEEILDRLMQLAVENSAVGHHDDRFEHGLVVGLQPDQLMREPRDRI